MHFDARARFPNKQQAKILKLQLVWGPTLVPLNIRKYESKCKFHCINIWNNPTPLFKKNVSNKQSFLARNPAACRLRPTAMFGGKQWERKRRRYESTCLIGLDLTIEYNAFLFFAYIFSPMARQTNSIVTPRSLHPYS